MYIICVNKNVFINFNHRVCGMYKGKKITGSVNFECKLGGLLEDTGSGP